jgi:glutamine---fructose-6-phosphate transaminase (isomerizing)
VKVQGGRAELVGEQGTVECFRLPDHGESVRPILEILPVQMITLALAALAGREPGKFKLATKVTTKE